MTNTTVQRERLSNQPFFIVNMDVFERYFSHHPPGVIPVFPRHLPLIVILPVFDDEDVFDTLNFLYNCESTGFSVGVLVVVNHGEDVPEEVKERNRRLADRLKKYTQVHSGAFLAVRVVEAFNMPARYAGVGLARKMAMDQAAAYFYEEKNPEGVIASLDADTRVAKNYLEELIHYFRRSEVAGVAIAYEHRLEEVDGSLRDAIIKYELYLRYYNLALQSAAHPYAYTCIGSAFAVRARDYVAQGGMNKRQAGEDFYFIQKLIATGRFAHLTTTRVYPSARISQRTPFGTGPTVSRIICDKGRYRTYHPEAFRALQAFFAGIPGLYKAGQSETERFLKLQPEGLQKFLTFSGFSDKIAEINANTASLALFRKRFFDNFNAFQVLKYLNFVHETYYDKVEIEEAVCLFFPEFSSGIFPGIYEALLLLRERCNGVGKFSETESRKGKADFR